MQLPHVLISVYQGGLLWKEYAFYKEALCVVGRAEDCDIQLPPDCDHADISRHHCLLEIDPPHIQVRDLGSRNGTYVNGEKIGQRPSDVSPEEADLSQFEAHEMKDGDVVRVGNAVFLVGVVLDADVLEPSHVPMFFV